MNNTCKECEKNKSSLPYEYIANPLSMLEEGGDWIQGAIKHPGRCTPGSPNYDCPKGSPQWNLAQRFKHGDLHKAQQGGEQEQIMQVITMYAQLHNTKPEVIIQKLQELDENAQQQALQSMVAELQQSGGAQQQQQQQQQQPQQSAPMSYYNNDESSEMESYEKGGANKYSQTGGSGYQGMAGGFDGQMPYAVPLAQTAIGDSKFLGPLKAITGYMGLASGLAASGLGYGKAIQWGANKILPDGSVKDGVNNAMESANGFLKNAVDFGTSGVLGSKNAMKQQGVAKYGGYLPKHQGDIPGVPSTVGSAGLMMYDGSKKDIEKEYSTWSVADQAFTGADGKPIDKSCEPGSDCDKAKKAENKNTDPNSGGGDEGGGAGDGPGSFNGMEYAQKGMIGFGAFRDYTQWKNDQKERREYDKMLIDKGNTDFRLASNNPNPFGDYTFNVGPSNNFQLGMTTPVQDSGTRSSKYGGTMKRSYKQGGEYQVSEEELLQLMQEGAEIEFINK